MLDFQERIPTQQAINIKGVARIFAEFLVRQLGGAIGEGGLRRARRPYPKVLPKYRNPKNRSETWAGRGKQPRWLTAQLRSGKKLGDFLIRKTSV